ncbi:hypothetical protein AYJ57_21550 (plasmid) [Salipiger sp. CCB-MM3]|nr:hypothetical protein AYJ57_21550 [Salipiger sp. CCB-MM3]
MLIAKPLEYPLRRVPLLSMDLAIPFQPAIDDLGKATRMSAYRAAATGMLKFRSNTDRKDFSCSSLPRGALNICSTSHLSLSKDPHPTY